MALTKITIRLICVLGGLTALVSGCQTGPTILTQMPAEGHLRPGETVLVDDGACPAGQIKQVVGGSNLVYKTDIKIAATPRQVSCIARPQ